MFYKLYITSPMALSVYAACAYAWLERVITASLAAELL